MNYSENKLGSACGRFLKNTALVAGAAVGAAAAANALMNWKTPPPDDVLGGVFARHPGRLGDLAYAVAGDGPPLLLLHGLGAGNSMAEWQANFGELAESFTVYALDYLGWGASDKPDARYDAENYAEQIEFFCEDVIGTPCAVVASNHSAAFALRAATRKPELLTGIVLICPPLPGGDVAVHEARARLVPGVMNLPIFGETLYNALASRKFIAEFSRRHLFFDAAKVDEAFIARHYIAAHQPGARRALTAFLAGEADCDAQDDWAALNIPALLVWGREAVTTPVTMASEWQATQPEAHLEVFDEARLMPHAEQPARFNELVARWLQG